MLSSQKLVNTRSLKGLKGYYVVSKRPPTPATLYCCTIHTLGVEISPTNSGLQRYSVYSPSSLWIALSMKEKFQRRFLTQNQFSKIYFGLPIIWSISNCVGFLNQVFMYIAGHGFCLPVVIIDEC